MLQGDRGVDLQVAVDVEQFPGVQRAPGGIVVHGFAGHHDRGGGCQRTGADADSAGKGWVFCGLSPPVVAKRMWAMNVVDRRSLACWANC